MLLLALLSLACVSDAVPLTRRMVDMSYTFDDTILHLPIVNKFQLDVVYNGTELNGIWMLGEDYSASVHLGTHMDAPAHFDPNGTAVDKIPIRHFVAPAAVIDITAKAELDPDCGATVEDLLHWERLTGQSLNQTIVLLKSGWGQKWNNMTAYIGSTEADINKMHFPGFSEESARWLVENRNIYGIGSETISFDRGAANTFPAHQIFLATAFLVWRT
ncbi:uncharacterized protein CEXT_275341 [Caerostris extrusa]|uniref:Kynurenine formamidase n=1 Tax=Caerostris extrusa TaxID=172846 RepID=A0AAV4VRW6_CAEEX|nr:uncharacterized protein CEXT_275341 [Caerostris extrusa]